MSVDSSLKSCVHFVIDILMFVYVWVIAFVVYIMFPTETADRSSLKLRLFGSLVLMVNLIIMLIVLKIR